MSDIAERLLAKAEQISEWPGETMYAEAAETILALRKEVGQLRDDHRKLALFHASGGTEVAWEDVDGIVAAALATEPVK